MQSGISSFRRHKHLPALDGIRLLAIGLVILHHTTAGSESSFWLHLIGLQKNNGFGHVLFFVLSGALVSTVILESHKEENRYRNFLARRFLRIFPLYFAYLLCAWVLTRIFTGAYPDKFWVYALFVQNFFYRVAENTNSSLQTYHLWTIAVQDQFYLVWPLLLWRCRSIRQMRILCCAGIGLSLLVRTFAVRYGLDQEVMLHSLPGVASCMCLGGLLSLEWTRPTWFTTFLRRSFTPLLLITLAWMWFGMDYSTPTGSIFGYHLVAVVCAGLILIASDPSSGIASFMGRPFFAFSGRNLAYGLYMFHPSLLDAYMVHAPIHSKGVRLGLFLLSTAVLAWVSYRYFETPFLRLKPRKRPAAKIPQAPAAELTGSLAG